MKKYGIQMPSFQKIGGLLANCMEIDAATLHAAVIAINQSIAEKVCTCKVSCLSILNNFKWLMKEYFILG